MPTTNTLLPLLYVGVGGLFGSVLRYLATLATQNVSLTVPYGTLISNLAGCFVIGVVTELATRSEILSTEARLFLATGLCGGFTTLSSLVYELNRLLQDQEYFYAATYFASTFFGAFLCFYLGVIAVSALMR